VRLIVAGFGIVVSLVATWPQAFAAPGPVPVPHITFGAIHPTAASEPTPIYGPLGPTPSAPAEFAAVHVRSTSAASTGMPESTITANCLSSEVLMSGGYEVSAFGQQVGVDVIGTYPSGNGWSVHFFGPTKFGKKAPKVDPFIEQVAAYAYCLDPGEEDIPIKTISINNAEVPAQGASPPALGAYAPNTQAMNVVCAPHAVLVGAGYDVEPPPSASEALLQNNGSIASFVPYMPDGRVDGWHIGISAIGPPLPTTLYARCASAVIKASPPSLQVENFQGSAPAISLVHLRIICANRAYAIAGGYTYQGDPLVPHPEFGNRSALSDGGPLENWYVDSIFAYQTPQYLTNDPERLCANTPSFCVNPPYAVACVQIPPIPRLTVQITSPPNGYTFPASTSGTRVALTAIVHDEHGAVVPNANLRWTVSGQPAPAAGSPSYTTLPYGGKFTIGVVARTSPLRLRRVATDSIVVNTQTVIP
jgi:hypothetical protein